MSSVQNVFISYSRSDEPVVEELKMFLKPLERQAYLNVWSDRAMTPGADRASEISKAIESADIAIILISADYLASDWTFQEELPRLLEQAETGKMRIFPIIVRPSSWVKTPLAYYQALPRGGQALTALSREERERVWVELSEAVLAAIHHVEAEERATDEKGRQISIEVSDVQAGRDMVIVGDSSVLTDDEESTSRGWLFISHAKEDGDFAEIVKFRLSERNSNSWIDTDILEAGLDWRQEIDQAILASSAVILVLSPSAKSSEYVTYEWAFALGSGLRIVPLLLRDTAIHPRLEAFQYLDFTNRRARPWNRLLSLLEDLQSDGPNQATPDGPVPPPRGSAGR